MKIKKRLQLLICLVILTAVLSCSKDNHSQIVDDRSFSTNEETDFFINRDGTVNLIVSGEFKDGDISFGTVISRGFVYGTTSNLNANSNNTSNVNGTNSATTGYIEGLTSGQTYFIRGYFEMSDGSYFYGNEIQASTNVDASDTRSITMEIQSTPFFISSTEITPQMDLSDVIKEMPIEIGYEYSLNSDFSNSNAKAIGDFDGAHNLGVISKSSYASELISGLTASTTYFFRPYAKYTNNTIVNGGTSTVSFTTN